jgi:RimJ/RimL family protein N-acetyltransferase
VKHDISIQGDVFRLRPVNQDDAKFIADLRSTDSTRLKYINRGNGQKEDQEAWLLDYFNRDGDYYWIIERSSDGTAHGTISLYNIDDNNKTAEWGRWILRKGSVAAVESTMLVFSIALDIMHLESVYSLTVAENASVVSFHDNSGVYREALIKGYFLLDGSEYDAVRHRLTRLNYPEVKRRLGRLSSMIAAKLIS